jgi:hypothetical protein
MILTSKQKEVINIAKEKGFVTFETFSSIYSSPISRKANLERFVALGLLVQTDIPGKFKLNIDKLKELE